MTQSINRGLVTTFVLVSWISSLDSTPTPIRIGGIFNTALEERVFRFTVDFVNRRNILGNGRTLVSMVNTTTYIDTFENIQLACGHAEAGVMALIGPITSTSVKAVAPVSGALHIPHIAPAATNPLLGSKKQFPYLVRMMPPDSVQSLALVDLVDYFHWNTMAILTSNTDYGVNGLVEFQSQASKRGWTVVSVQRFNAATPPTDTVAISQLQITKETGVRVIILNCLAVYSREILRQARDLEMTGPGWAWIVTDGTTGTNEVLEPYIPDYVVGLLGTIPSVGNGALYGEFDASWDEMNAQEGNVWPDLDAYSALVADSVLTFAFAAKSMFEDLGNDTVDIANETITCDDSETGSTTFWSHGHTLLKHITKVNENGAASYIEFNSQAAPLRPVFDIVNLKEDGWMNVGHWTPQDKLVVQEKGNISFMGGQRAVLDYVSSLANKTLNIVTIEEKPFISLLATNYDPTNLQPHDIEGYCIDLLDMLANITGFTYNMYLVADGSFGRKDPETGQWDGMVQDLVIRKADMAAADFTISYSREKDIDFTNPYLDLGMTFVLKKPEKLPVDEFKFLEPFTAELWMYILATALVVGIMVSFFNKLSPNDYHGHFIYCVNDSLEKESMTTYAEWKRFKRKKNNVLRELSLTNSIWFSVASLLSQGGEAYPRSLSGRLTGVFWWLAIVILISTYTANLAAFLTSSRTKTYINSVDDLASQSKILYGTAAQSAPHQFFLDSRIDLYQDMITLMNTRNTFVSNSYEGIEKVRNGDFAYVWDSAVLEYIVEEEPCDLQTVGRIFGKLGYGFGLQKNSPYTQQLSSLILQLRETGFIDQLKHKWFVERGQCSGNKDSSAAADQIAAAGGKILVSHMLGVFYIIYGAIVLAFVVLMVEWIVFCYEAVDPNDPYMQNSLTLSIRKHLRLLKKDIIEDFLPRLPSLGALRRVEWGKASIMRRPNKPPSAVTVPKSPMHSIEGVQFKMAKYEAQKFQTPIHADVNNVQQTEYSNIEPEGIEFGNLNGFGNGFSTRAKDDPEEQPTTISSSSQERDIRKSSFGNSGYNSTEKLWF